MESRDSNTHKSNAMIVDNQHEMLEAIKSKERKRRSNTLILVTVLSSLAIATLFVNYLTHKKLEKENADLEAKKGTLDNIDSSLNLARQKDTLVNLIFEYYARKDRDDTAILELFCDTLDRYYLQENLSRNKALKEDRRYWSRFPNESITLDSTIATNIDPMTGRATASVRGRYCRSVAKCSELITYFRFDERKKIYYVRSFYADEMNPQRTVFGTDTLPD